MSSEWKPRIFGDLVDFVSEKAKADAANLATYISTENMEPNFGGVKTAATLPGSGSVTKFIVSDTLFSNIRTYFKKVWQAECEGHCSNDVLVFRTKDQRTLLPSYLHNLCRWERFTEFSVRTSKGAKMPRGDKDALVQFQFELPPIEEQRSITETLGSLDDRIALLRDTNATLEAIAQALFKSWFVDFDPVHAKQQGIAPEGLDEATAALFPDGFEESELGLVPRGWRRVSFTDTVKVIGGGTPKTTVEEYWNGDIPWFSVVDAPDTADVFVIDTTKHITELGLNNSSTKLLDEGTTIISARGTVGRLALVGKTMAMNQSCYGLRGKASDAYFTYFSTYRLVESLKQRSHGSVFDTITTETMKGVSVIYPDTPVIHAFETVLTPVMNRLKTNLEQAQTLATLRDTLLPRLISGQLRITDIEEVAA